MLELTPRAQRVIDQANRAAEERGDGYVGTEHLLIGLLSEPDGLGAQAITRFASAREVTLHLFALLSPPTRSGFESHPAPWTSGVIHDSSGDAQWNADGTPCQFFIGANGVPVRDAEGNLVHLKFGADGSPVMAHGEPEFLIIDVAPGSRDAAGRPLKEL